MKKLLLALTFCLTCCILAACGGSGEPSKPEEKVYIEESQIDEMFADPSDFKGKYVKLNGWTIEAEVYGDGVDMWLRSQGENVVMEET